MWLIFTTRYVIHRSEMVTGIYLRLQHVGVLLEELFQLYWKDLVSDPDNHVLNPTHVFRISAILQYE
jgi:hypothetical protein